VSGEGGLLSLAVAVALDDELVGGRLEPVDDGLGEERVGDEGEPLDGFTVGCDDGWCSGAAFDDD
jgi:hypothetical protein